MDTEKSLLEEEKVKIKGGRLSRCKTPLVCLACLVLAGLFTALTVLMVKIEKDNQFIINSLLPSIRKHNEFQDWKNANNHAEHFPGRVVWNQERISEKSGNADEELGDDTWKYEAPCTGGFIHEGDLCYLHVLPLKTWDAAADHCRSLGAYLAEPRTQGQVDFLKSVSSKYNTPLWLGATDQAEEGKWVWAQSGAAVGGPTDWPTDWSPNQPDDWRSGEDCLEIRTVMNFKWNDVQCELRRAFVCQKEITRKENATYKVYKNKRTHTEASQACQSHGGKLALPKTAVEYQNMKNVLKQTLGAEHYVWIGIMRYGNEWSYRDGTLLGSWNNWANKQPNNWGGNQDCVEMRILIENKPVDHENFDGWNDEKCSNKIQYMCEFNKRGCAQGSTHIYGECYVLVKEKKSWEDAQASCIAKGGFLAEPRSPQDSENIRKFAMDNGAMTPWIGGTFREGRWVWSHSGESVNYTDWYEGEPNNGLGNEFCLAINEWYHWNDAPCNWQEQYICQM